MTDNNTEDAGKVLVVDDEPNQRMILEEAVKGLGYSVTVVESGGQAVEKAKYGNFDVLITDMQMPGMDGIKVLENVMKVNSSVSVILCTAHGTIETAVEAMKKGAEDYILKPVEFSALEVTLSRVFRKRQLVRENRKLLTENEALKRDLGIKFHITSSLGRSDEAKKMIATIEKNTSSRAPLLLLGEPGVGKEEIARMIHYNSAWARNDLIDFDCAAVPEEFQETHLFGEEHVGGETDLPSRPGLIEKAHLGSLVLSNVHKLSTKCQPRLSKVLQEQKAQRVGGRRFYQVFVRVMATSTKEDFEKVVAASEFRWDLHDKFFENMMEIPALRDRKEDLPIIIAAMTKHAANQFGKEITKVDKGIIDKLLAYDFPGNNKELEAMVESAVIRCNENELKLEHFAFQQG